MTDFSAIRGANYVPSTAASSAQFWEEFDRTTIVREIGFAASLGLNSVRVFLQYRFFEQDPDQALRHFREFLEIAHTHGISVLPVLFDDCFAGEPVLAPYPTPTPGQHNAVWAQSPGRSRLALRYRPALRRYMEAFVGTFAEDIRIVAWEIYNEPAGEPPSVALMKDAFAWARRLTGQSLTACWSGTYLSDITNVHLYTSPTQHPTEVETILDSAESLGKPILVTEFLGRPYRGTFAEVLPLLSGRGIGWYFWELMIGNTQVDQPWSSDRATHPQNVAFQGLLYPDGTPYEDAECELLRNHTSPTTITGPTVNRETERTQA